MLKKSEKLNIDNLLFVSFCVTVVALFYALTLSVDSYFDKVLFVVTLFLAVISVFVKLKKNRKSLFSHIKSVFSSSKILCIAILAYLIWEMCTLLYTKDISLALQKYPFRMMYFSFALIGIYCCRNVARLMILFKVIASIAVIVATSAYLVYMLSVRPIYFQRLSTARDYNIFSSIMLFSMIFGIGYMLVYSKMKFSKKLLFYIGYLLYTMPAYYLAGSRRHIIMAPIFVAFALIFEIVRGIRNIRFKEAKGIGSVLKPALMISICIAVYIGAYAFSFVFANYADARNTQYYEMISNASPEEAEDIRKDEISIEEAKQSIVNSSMSNKRLLIYSVAMSDVMNSDTLKLIFGGGSSYDMYMYNNTNDVALLSSYGYNTADNRPENGWMYSHNFMLTDVLCGGIIQLLLGVFIVIAMVYSAIKAIGLDSRCGIILIIPTSLVVVNNFISFPYGFLNDSMFSVLIIVFCSFLYVNGKEKVAVCE